MKNKKLLFICAAFLGLGITGCESAKTDSNSNSVKESELPVTSIISSSPNTSKNSGIFPITPKVDAMQAASNINNIPVGDVTKIKSEKALVCDSNSEWSYTHHPFITYFKGSFYALWSNGRKNEDDLGQRVMMATSKDFYNWSDSKPLADTTKGINSELVLTPGGWHVYNDSLTAYYYAFEYLPETLRENNTLRPKSDTGHYNLSAYSVTTTDGITWGKPKKLTISRAMNFGPEKTKSGRLIISGAANFPYTDDPSGLTGWVYTAIAKEGVDKAKVNGAKTICEGSFFQTDDQIIYMMSRSNTQHLYCSISYDNGESWTAPYETKFTDDNAKFHFGRLPDGRFYYVGNPVVKSSRLPLTLCISKDGVNFDKHYIIRDEPYTVLYSGMYKTGVYGYPNTLVHDGYLYSIYSKRKECIEVSRIALEDIK